jgi:hypothetical protein
MCSLQYILILCTAPRHALHCTAAAFTAPCTALHCSLYRAIGLGYSIREAIRTADICTFLSIRQLIRKDPGNYRSAILSAMKPIKLLRRHPTLLNTILRMPDPMQ